MTCLSSPLQMYGCAAGTLLCAISKISYRKLSWPVELRFESYRGRSGELPYQEWLMLTE